MKAFLTILALVAPSLGFAQSLWVSTLEGGLYAFDPKQWRMEAQLEGLSQAAKLALEPGGRTAWTVDPNRDSLHRIDLETGSATGETLKVSGTARDLAWIGEGGLLAFITQETPSVFLADPNSRTPTASIHLPGLPQFLANSKSPGTLAVVLKDPQRLCLIDTRQKKIMRELPLPYPAWDLEFSNDGRWVAASHEDYGLVSLLDLQGRQLARRLEVGPNPRGLALSPDGKRLWVTHAMGSTGGVSAIAVTANAVTASFRVVGDTYGMRYLAADSEQPERLVVAAHIPQAQKTGMLYAFSADLGTLISNQPLSGTPGRILVAPKPKDSGQEAASTTVTAAAPTPAPTKAAKPRKRRGGLLKSGFEGMVVDASNGRIITGSTGKAEAVNRRGRRYQGHIDEEGGFIIDGLPWGTYQLVFELPGYGRHVIPEQLLAFRKAPPMRVELKRKTGGEE